MNQKELLALIAQRVNPGQVDQKLQPALDRVKFYAVMFNEPESVIAATFLAAYTFSSEGKSYSFSNPTGEMVIARYLPLFKRKLLETSHE